MNEIHNRIYEILTNLLLSSISILDYLHIIPNNISDQIPCDFYLYKWVSYIIKILTSYMVFYSYIKVSNKIIIINNILNMNSFLGFLILKNIFFSKVFLKNIGKNLSNIPRIATAPYSLGINKVISICKCEKTIQG